MKRYLILLLMLSACSGNLVGKIDPKAITNDRHIVFGKINYYNQSEKTAIGICFLDSQENESCGSLLLWKKYIKYDEEKQYNNYVAIPLPPGKTRISKISIVNSDDIIGGSIDLLPIKGLDFYVDPMKSATYFGDITLSVSKYSSEVQKIENNATSTLQYLQSINKPMNVIKDYSVNLTNPLIEYNLRTYNVYMTPAIK